MFRQQMEECKFNLKLSSQKMENYKKTLLHQADRAKQQIKTNIDMQMDGLTQRKHWLLNQLEVVKTDKLEAINCHEEAVNCLMYNIECYLNDANNYTSIQLQEELEKIRSLLSNELQPFLAFKADSGELREVISQYGNILNRYCGHFADPTRPSVSLPRMVEEEEEEEVEHNGNSNTAVPTSRCSVMSNKIGTDTDKMEKDGHIIHVTKRPENSYVVKAWLMSTASTLPSSNGNDFENDLGKSDSDSFVRIDGSTSSHDRFRKDSINYWLNTKNDLPANLSDILRPFNAISSQKNESWLFKPNGIDEEKELDHQDYVKKVCVGGQCRSFQDCHEKENCCNRLLDSSRPCWSQWLINNNVVNRNMLRKNKENDENETYEKILSTFNKILNSDSSIWLLNSSNDKNGIDGGSKEANLKTEKCDSSKDNEESKAKLNRQQKTVGSNDKDYLTEIWKLSEMVESQKGTEKDENFCSKMKDIKCSDCCINEDCSGFDGFSPWLTAE